MPITRVSPAAEELLSCSMGWRTASTVSAGAKPWTISRSADVVFSACPKMPSRDTRANSAGKIERTE